MGEWLIVVEAKSGAPGTKSSHAAAEAEVQGYITKNGVPDADVDLLASAVEAVCRRRDRAFRQVNVEILGNTDPFLHAHIWPRYEWEPEHLLKKPVRLYPAGNWSDPQHALGAAHDDLRSDLVQEIAQYRNSVDFNFNV